MGWGWGWVWAQETMIDTVRTERIILKLVKNFLIIPPARKAFSFDKVSGYPNKSPENLMPRKIRTCQYKLKLYHFWDNKKTLYLKTRQKMERDMGLSVTVIANCRYLFFR
jgi:hypothetical protein